MFYFHKVEYVQYLGEVDIFHTWVKKYSSLQQCKKYKNRSRFSKVMVTNVLPPFLWFTVYNVNYSKHQGCICQIFTGGQSFDWRLATIAGMEVAKLVPWNSLLNQITSVSIEA